jgi:radical SAM protein with 4Fe4S-binding SPASM domain
VSSSSASIDRRLVLHLVQPDLRRQRGQAWLLVWGGLTQWLVVDEELLGFLDRFDGRTQLGEVLHRHAKARRKAPSEIETEALAVTKELVARGILSTEPTTPEPPDDPVSIANVTLNITNRCNLSCDRCYNRDHRPADAPVDVLVRGICSGASVLESDASLVVLGGEPLLDPDRLFAVLDGTADLFGQRPVVSTNGTLVTGELAKALARREVEVQVSVDHHLDTKHDAIRGSGSWNRAIDGARCLVDAGVYTMLCRVYVRGDEGQLEPYFDMARSLAVQEVRLIPLRAVGGGLAVRGELPDQRAFLDELIRLLGRRPELGSLMVRDWFSIAATLLGRGAGRNSCGIGRRVVLLDSDGAVYPCPNHTGPEHCAGHVAEQDLSTILRDAPVFKSLRERYQIARYKGCPACPFRGWCAGDCRGEALALTGDPGGPSPHCKELRTVYTELLWLMATDQSPLGERARLADGRPVPRETWQ